MKIRSQAVHEIILRKERNVRMGVKRPGSRKVQEKCGKHKPPAPLSQDNYVLKTAVLGPSQ